MSNEDPDIFWLGAIESGNGAPVWVGGEAEVPMEPPPPYAEPADHSLAHCLKYDLRPNSTDKLMMVDCNIKLRFLCKV